MEQLLIDAVSLFERLCNHMSETRSCSALSVTKTRSDVSDENALYLGYNTQLTFN
jgi:hypothetical protein